MWPHRCSGGAPGLRSFTMLMGTIRKLTVGSRFLVLAVTVTLAAGCGKSSKESGGSGKDAPPGIDISTYPATDEGAKSVLLEFTKPGADQKALLRHLKPTQADFAALFQPEFARKAEAHYAT